MVNAWDKFVIFSGIIFHDGYEMLCYGLEIVHSVCRGNSPSFNRCPIELNGLAYVWQAVKWPEAKRRSSVHLWDSQVGPFSSIQLVQTPIFIRLTPPWFFGPCWIWRSKILRSESPGGWDNSQLTTGRLGSMVSGRKPWYIHGNYSHKQKYPLHTKIP